MTSQERRKKYAEALGRGHGVVTTWMVSAAIALADEEISDAKAETWDEASEAVQEWTWNNPGPSGIPSDPPNNPYIID